MGLFKLSWQVKAARRAPDREQTRLSSLGAPGAGARGGTAWRGLCPGTGRLLLPRPNKRGCLNPSQLAAAALCSLQASPGEHPKCCLPGRCPGWWEEVTLGNKRFSLDMGEGVDRPGYGFAVVRTGLLHLPEHRGAEPLERAWGAPPGLQKDRGLPGSSDASASPGAGSGALLC